MKSKKQKLSKDKKRTNTVSIRFNSEEVEIVEKLRSEGGFATTAGLLRHLVLTKQLSTIPTANMYAVSELHRIGVNLNAVIKKINCSGVASDADIENINLMIGKIKFEIKLLYEPLCINHYINHGELLNKGVLS